jgi:hypothetical protein
MSSSSIEVGGSLSNTAPITTTAGNEQIPPPAVTQVLPPIQRALNSTPQDDSILNLSRGSRRSRGSVDEEMLREIQAMNHNIAMMLANQVKEEKRFDRLEQLISVSRTCINTINTSTGLSVAPTLSNATNVVYCFSQAGPSYARPQSHGYEAQRGQPAFVQQVTGAPSMYVPTVREMRGDQSLVREAEERCAEMDASVIGNSNYVTSKKAQGLLRAGGEASRHVHIDWPHDHILVGPDKERVYYKNLNM